MHPLSTNRSIAPSTPYPTSGHTPASPTAVPGRTALAKNTNHAIGLGINHENNASTQASREVLLSSILTLLQNLDSLLKGLSSLEHAPATPSWTVPTPPETGNSGFKHPLSVNPAPALQQDIIAPTKTLQTSQLADLSSKRNGAPPADIEHGLSSLPSEFNEMRYTENYVTIIKLLMMRFGQSPTDCFDSVTPSNAGYDIVMKDGEQVTVTPKEIKQAGDAAKFSGHDSEMIKDANFMFTAYIKRVQQSHDNPVIRASFDAALHEVLWHGGHEKRILEDLGMVAFMNHVNARELSENTAPGFIYYHGLVTDREALPYDGHGYILT